MTTQIYVALIGCIGTVLSAWIANRARQEVKAVSEKVEPVSNGFAGSVLETLVEIRGELSEVRKDLSVLRDDLESHIRGHEHAPIVPLPRRRRRSG